MALLLFVGVFLTLILSVTWSGYILSILWSWFMVPIFGLPVLSVPAAIGVTIVFGYFIRGVSMATAKKDEFTETIVTAFLTPLVFLFMGWIVKSFL